MPEIIPIDLFLPAPRLIEIAVQIVGKDPIHNNSANINVRFA